MDILKCDMCGGTLVTNEDENVTICEYCGTKRSLTEKRLKKQKNIFFTKLKGILKNNYVLSFPLAKMTFMFSVFTIIFYIYSLISLGVGGVHGQNLYKFTLMFLPFITPLLICAKIIKRKRLAITFEAISLIGTLVYFCRLPFSFCNEFFLTIIVTLGLDIIWMILVCLTRKTEFKPSEKRKWYSYIFPTVISITIIFIFHMYGISYFDYQYTRYIDQRFETVKIGESVWFGKYEQDNDKTNGKEAIGWIVLDKQEDKVLVVSHYALDWKMFNDDGGSASWKHSSLRKWLNSEFLNSAFTGNMHTLISTTTVTPGRNYENIAFPVVPTQDKIFLLSYEEANKYFKSYEARRCAPTKYAKARGIGISDGCVNWWLRSPRAYYYRVPTGNSNGAQFLRQWKPYNESVDYDYSAAAYANYAGGISTNGESLDHRGIGVRPAMWIDTSKAK